MKALSRSTRARTPVAVAALALSLTLGLAACSGGDSDEEWTPNRPNGTFSPGSEQGGAGATPGASAGAAAPGATPGKANGAKVPGASLAQQIEAAAAKAKSADFDVQVTGVQPMTASGSTAGSGSNLQLKMDAVISETSKVEIIKTGGVVYLKPPSSASSGKTWLKITSAKNDPYRTFYDTLFSNLERSGDVGAAADVIGQISSFRAESNETVDGVQTTKYVATPPAKTGVQLMPATFRQVNDQILAGAKSEVSVWVDGDGLLRRTAITVSLPQSQDTASSTSKQLVSYQNWGKGVKVSAPPASQVAAAGAGR